MKEKDQKSVGSHVVLAGSARAVRPGAKILGVADPDEWIEVSIKVRRKKALPEIGKAAVKPLSIQELETQYGAEAAGREKVRTVLTAAGVKVLKEDVVSCSVRAGARAEVWESVFQVRLFHYAHSEGNY